MEDMKADMQAKLDELQEKLQAAEQACSDSQKQASLLQHQLDDARKEQGVLEEQVHEGRERMEELENERKESVKARRELEQIYESERAQTMKEKEEQQAKEEEMQSSLQRMKETLAQKEMRAGLDEGGGGRPTGSRSSSFRSNAPSPNPEAGQFAPPSSVQRSDSRSSSKLVMQKDKIIEGLRLELAEAQIKLVEVENMGGGRMQDLQRQMYDVKMQNARLMEENESFQLLLTQRTLEGDFSHNEFLRPPSNSGNSRPPSRQPNAGGASLADELNGEDVDQSFVTDGGASVVTDEQAKRLQSELSSLKDQNKALTLYINNIISRLLQHEQFETILDKTPDIMAGPGAASQKGAQPDTDKDLPPPPPPKDEKPATAAEKPKEESVQEDDEKPVGFIQRAKSVIGGGRSRPRPATQGISSSDQEKLQAQIRAAEEAKVNENPETAPRVPVGRSVSTRGGGHRRANSEWTAANLVGNMYKGPSTGWQGPASPGLASPTSARNSFFAAPQPLGARVPSGSSGAGAVPTIAESGDATKDKEKENRDSRLSNPSSSTNTNTQSHRSSVISSGGNLEPESSESGGGPATHSTPSSPPRSTTSSGDRDKGGGAVMKGSKPRPLRLVQEAAEDEAAKKAANRGSWFGWMNKGGSSGGGGGAGRTVSGGGGEGQ